MGFIKRHQRAVMVTIMLCVLAGTGGLYYLKTSETEFAAGIRGIAGDFLHPERLPHKPDLTRGLRVTGKSVYVDGIAGVMPECEEEHDVKVVYNSPDGIQFCDYTTGFSVSLPSDMAADLTNSPKFISFQSPYAKLVVSREWTYDPDVSGYVEAYFFKFLLDESYRGKNNIELLERTKTDRLELLSVRLNGCPDKFDTYTYLIFKTRSQDFYYAMLKYSSGDQTAAALTQRVMKSFRYFMPQGAAADTTDYYPEIPENWSEETRALYEKIKVADHITWGIFTKDVNSEGISSKIPELERRLDHKFGIVLTYTGLDGEFPARFMERCYSEGRLVELTLQTTESDNLNLIERSPWLELYRTGDDDRIREFARAARAFGKPFLFRLNNEMNSNWVIYGGVLNLLDPDIFVENWRTVYRIFAEEGVNNAIWIFNPNDRDAPPNAWNSQTAYYPGNGYVQLYGVTGYNNGTYYEQTMREGWREFDTIYDRIEEEASGLFGAFPWVITEFSSSSLGGDKAKWIDGMFRNLGRYQKIKAAVWFSYADFDPKDNTTVSRPYWLDETDATLAAFKRGLDGSK